jgi:hypothetical protein
MTDPRGLSLALEVTFRRLSELTPMSLLFLLSFVLFMKNVKLSMLNLRFRTNMYLHLFLKTTGLRIIWKII